MKTILMLLILTTLSGCAAVLGGLQGAGQGLANAPRNKNYLCNSTIDPVTNTATTYCQ